ncbi:ammonium transporter Rh type A-like [Clytia hemisphaerica]|uniref:Ammonium transporter AmtB-like domain-containing protein n=1 Tax=Clytia hemisphaerica TaxID=252671 RepID=A0A7M6DMT3_9CNID
MAALPKPTFSICLFLFQILLLALFAKYAEYGSVEKVNSIYPQFQDVHVMMFFGFGFLMCFLKKYGFGSITYNFLLSAVVIQWATLMNSWVKHRIMKEEGHLTRDPNVVQINILTLMTSDFTAAAVLITMGAVLGKASRLQLFILAVVECIFFAISEAVILEFLHISDVGGSIVVHLFGAYFGLAVSAVLQNSGGEHPKESSTKNSDLFSMAGTIFLWMYWPSFNSGTLAGDDAAQSRAVINTYFALASCVVTTLVFSPIVDKRYRSNMVHIQNATLAGGVAVGTSADLMIQPWGAILIGMIAAIFSVLGYAYVTPFLSSKLKIHDTCGVHNLHGMPAVLAAIFSAIAAPAIGEEGKMQYAKTRTGEWSFEKQGGFQIAAAFVALAFAIVGGVITGLIIKQLDGIDNEDDLYDDQREFIVPDDDIEANGNVHEMKPTNAS